MKRSAEMAEKNDSGVPVSGQEAWRHGGDWAGFLAEYGRMPLDFSSNISPMGLPAGVRRALAEAADAWERYPDPACRRLREALGEYFSVDPGRIVCGNGAADLIYRLVRALRPKRALLTEPGFSEYEKALREIGCEIRKYRLDETNDFDLAEDILGAVTPDIDLLFLCNPNNPTGRMIAPERMDRIRERCRETGTFLAVDECFLEMTGRREESLIYRGNRQREAVIRAFTKSFAMPGLRLGYLVCSDRELAARLRESGAPWAVSAPAQIAGVAALQEKEYLSSLRERIREERFYLQRGLTALGMRVIPGEANYLLFRCSDRALDRKLREDGLLIRRAEDFGGLSAEWYRIAVRTRAENEILLEAMRKRISPGGAGASA